MYCTVIFVLFFFFLFLFASGDLSYGLVKLGKSRSLSVLVLVEGWTRHLPYSLEIFQRRKLGFMPAAAPEVMSSPPGTAPCASKRIHSHRS